MFRHCANTRENAGRHSHADEIFVVPYRCTIMYRTARFSTWFILLCHFFTHYIALHCMRAAISRYENQFLCIRKIRHRTNSLSSWYDFLLFRWNILITNETFIWAKEDKRISGISVLYIYVDQTVEKKTVLVSSKCNRFTILIILMSYITLDCLKVKSICVTPSWYWNFRKCECISSVQNQLWFSSKISISFN